MANSLGKLSTLSWIDIHGIGLQTQMYMDFMDAYGLDYPYPNKVSVRSRRLRPKSISGNKV